MKLRFSIALLCAGIVCAQAPAPVPTPAAPPSAPPGSSSTPPLASVLQMPDSAVFATADGKKITAGELKGIVQKIPPQQLSQVNSRDLLMQLVLLKRFSTEALTQKLDQRSPYKEELATARDQVLASAYISDMRERGITVTPEEVQKHYDTNKNRYEQARIKLIYFAFNDKPAPQADPAAKKPATEAEAKAKADAVLKDLRAGGDFVKAVKENSDDPVSKAKDGDFGTALHRTDPIPENVKSVVFSLKPGQVSEIVRQPNGFYIFRAEEIGLQPFDKVRDQVSKELKDSKFQDWMQKSRSSIQIAFEPAPAPPGPAAAAVH